MLKLLTDGFNPVYSKFELYLDTDFLGVGVLGVHLSEVSLYR